MLPWGDLIEDFLDTIGVSLEGMRDELSGGWMFGYIEALRRAGVDVDLVCVSARVDSPLRWRHGPTGASIRLLPAARAYRALRGRLADPYAWTKLAAVGGASGAALPAALLARQLAPYCATPVARLTQVLRAEGYDALLCQEYEYPRFDVCVALGKALRVPVFATFQGGVHHLAALEGAIRPLTLRACKGVIIGPRREGERVRRRYGLGPDKIARIFNPLDVDEWAPQDRARARRELGIDQNALVVAWHGRIDIYRKGLDVLCHAWRELYQRRADTRMRLLLVGTGTDSSRLRRSIVDLRLQGVLWLDEYVLDRDRLRRCLSAADVYVFPSRDEGFPVAPIEAMASGLPVVAADASGIADIFEGGEASGGIIVPRVDAAALASTLERVLNQDGWRRQLGAQARRRAHAAFALESVGRQLRDFLATPSQASRRAEP